MDFAENAETLGIGLQSGADGARRSVESGREGVRGKAGTEEVGGGETGNGLTGMKNTGVRKEGSGQRAEEMRVDLIVVKQEVMDWSEMEEGMLGGQRVKQEVEDEPEVEEEKPGTLEVKEEVDNSLVVKEEKVNELEVKEEKVKVKEEVMDWLEVKEEKKDNLEIKQEETFGGQNIKEEEMMDEVCIKEEKYFSKREVMDDTKVKEEPQINPPVDLKRKLAMSRCGTCGTKEAKYRCPRCMRYSCSLPCVKKHKAELTCNGVRDKTAYISIPQFTEMNLLSDYRFLEDVARKADHISRDVFLKRPISNKHMYFMKNRARKQGISLKLLPNGFTKRKENSTFFDKKVPEDKTISEILRPYIDPENSDPVIRQRLKAYIHCQTGVQILMKVEHMQQNVVSFGTSIIRTLLPGFLKGIKLTVLQGNNQYYELEPYKSLLDNLRNKVIIEFPTLHVVLKGSSDAMKVLHQVKNESNNIGNEN